MLIIFLCKIDKHLRIARKRTKIMMNIFISYLVYQFTQEVQIQVIIIVISKTEIILKEDGWSSMIKLSKSLTFQSLRKNALVKSLTNRSLGKICGGKAIAMHIYYSMKRNQLIRRIKKSIINKTNQLQYLYHFKISHPLLILTNLLTIWMQISTIVSGPKMKHL